MNFNIETNIRLMVTAYSATKSRYRKFIKDACETSVSASFDLHACRGIRVADDSKAIVGISYSQR